MIKINLISDLEEKKHQTKKLNSYVIIGSIGVVVLILMVIVIFWGIIGTEKALTASTNKKIDDTNSQLAKYKDLETTVVSLEKGLAGAKEILNGKDQWTKLLVHLEGATPADVQFTKIKLSDQKIEADLTGKDINSLSRFIDSYKNYTILALAGAGNEGQTVTIATGEQSYVTQVNTSGSWDYAVKFDPAKDQNITVTKKATDAASSDSALNIKYTAADQKLTTDSGVSGTVKNLFTDVDSKGYTKDPNGQVKFSVTMNFDGASLW